MGPLLKFVTFAVFTVNTVFSFGLYLQKSEVSSFEFEGSRVRIWASARNDPSVSPSEWNFRYEPIMTPLRDESKEVSFRTVKYGSLWATDFLLALDSEEAKALALRAIGEVYSTDDFVSNNVFAIPIKRMIVSVPGLHEQFPDVEFATNGSSCPARSACYDLFLQAQHLRIVIISKSEDEALNVCDFLWEAKVVYEITTFDKLKTFDGAEEILVDSFTGHIDLSSRTYAEFTSFGNSREFLRKAEEIERVLIQTNDALVSEKNERRSLSLKILEVEELTKQIEQSHRQNFEELTIRFSGNEACKESIKDLESAVSENKQKLQEQNEMLKATKLDHNRLHRNFTELLEDCEATDSRVSQKISYFQKKLNELNSDGASAPRHAKINNGSYLQMTPVYEKLVESISSLEPRISKNELQIAELYKQKFEAISNTTGKPTRNPKQSTKKVFKKKLVEQFWETNTKCSKDWQKFCSSTECHCYKFLKQEVDWTYARQLCQSFSADLASIHSPEEQDFVKTLVVGNMFAWIGLNDMAKEGEFVWSDGSLVTYTNWYREKGGQQNIDHLTDQPNGGYEENCVDLMTEYGYDGEWNDASCTKASSNILCKKPANQ